MYKWESLFKSHILERGLNYFEEGAISSLECNENCYSAVVTGTEDYQVEIEFQEGQIAEMFCDCPYADEGNHCKHMAAVLHMIEMEDRQSKEPKDWVSRHEERISELEQVISKIPEEDLRKLLLQMADNNKALGNRLLLTYSEKIDERQFIRLKREVDAIAYEYSDRSGFVDYYHASAYTDEMSAFLHEKVGLMIEKNHLKDAFELTNYVFECITNQEMDDSEGGIIWIADICYEYWQEILRLADDVFREEMFGWFMKYKENHMAAYMEGYIEDFLMEEFQEPELLKQRLNNLDEMIEKAQHKNDYDQYYASHSEYEDCVLQRIQVMRKLGCAEREIRDYRKKYRHFSSVRRTEIQEYIQTQQYERAIEVLKESKILDASYYGLVSGYSKQLVDIYHKIGKSDLCKAELKYYVLKCSQVNLQYIKMLKTLCGESEWEQLFEQIITAPSVWSIKYELLESEGLYDRLLKEIADSGYINHLDRYEKVLKEKYPEQVRDIYIRHVLTSVKRVSDRKWYKELVKYLKKITKYPGGKAKAEGIATEWKSVYKRRRAMMDELRKGGF